MCARWPGGPITLAPIHFTSLLHIFNPNCLYLQLGKSFSGRHAPLTPKMNSAEQWGKCAYTKCVRARTENPIRCAWCSGGAVEFHTCHPCHRQSMILVAKSRQSLSVRMASHVNRSNERGRRWTRQCAYLTQHRSHLMKSTKSKTNSKRCLIWLNVRRERARTIDVVQKFCISYSAVLAPGQHERRVFFYYYYCVQWKFRDIFPGNLRPLNFITRSATNTIWANKYSLMHETVTACECFDVRPHQWAHWRCTMAQESRFKYDGERCWLVSGVTFNPKKNSTVVCA